jgi:hypothetical protein
MVSVAQESDFIAGGENVPLQNRIAIQPSR